MPGTDREYIGFARLFCTEVLMPDQINDIVWEDGSHITYEEGRQVLGLVMYEFRRRNRYNRQAQRRALRLLWRFLTAAQRAQFRSTGYFYVRAASGQVYRLCPDQGWTSRVERHGKRYFQKSRFCLHDFPTGDLEAPDPERREMPPADVVLAHLLLLTTNEPEFLAAANEWPRKSDLWDGDYLRRVRRQRIQEANAL